MISRYGSIAACAALISLLNTTIALAQSGTQVYAAWSQITGSAAYSSTKPAPAGYMDLNISLRVVIDTGDATASCPDFYSYVDKGGKSTLQPLTWTKRTNNPSATRFPMIVCQAPAPNDADTITLLESVGNTTPVTFSKSNGQKVILPGANLVGNAGPPTFVALGDTGCRGLHNHRGKQECDPGKQSTTHETKFLFDKVAQQAAALNPDFVVHLGDYRYDKESNRTFDVWDSDFFERVRLGLLTELPWAFIRGNHEECSLAGQGWFFFFGPGSPTSNCASSSLHVISETWYFDVADRSQNMADPHRFIVLDTSPTVHHSNTSL